MLPILVAWGPFVLPAWHTFYVVGALVAFWAFVLMAERQAPTLPRPDLARLFALCYVAGYFGARLLSIVVEEPSIQGPVATFEALLSFGPMTFYGGAIAAFLIGSLYVWMRSLPFATLFDLGLPAGLLALAIGRIGCFLNGDDYGKAVPLEASGTPPFWAVTFPNLQDGIARYPVQLFEAAAVALWAGLLYRYFTRLRRAFRPGIIGFLSISGYANARFFLEFLRDDFRGFVFGTWLSTSQFISVVLLAACGLSLPLWLRSTQAPDGR